jgi:ABC-2 type transport system ATP-binding protein
MAVASKGEHVDLVIENLSKRYRGDVWGLQDFSLTIHTGVFGLLGPNGAGKTTLMNILATVTRPTQGKVSWDGLDIFQQPNLLRENLGYLPQDFGVYPNLNPVEFLEYLAALKGLSGRKARRRIDDLLQLVNLTEARARPLGGFSGGMKQRVGIAQALLNDPKLLIVDEPTAGLDPEERVRFRNLIANLSGERIIILSTHIVSDVEAAATQIALISQGRLLQAAPPEALLSAVDRKVWRLVVPSSDLAAARERHLISNMVRRPDGVHLRVVAGSRPGPDAVPQEPTLEDAYLHFMTAHNQAARPRQESA